MGRGRSNAIDKLGAEIKGSAQPREREREKRSRLMGLIRSRRWLRGSSAGHGRGERSGNSLDNPNG